MSVDWTEIGAIATAVAALTSAGLAFLTGWTLIVLRDYARDTKRLAETSLEQLESSQTPFVVLCEGQDTPRGVIYRIENEGAGPAMNVTSQVEWSNGAKGTYGPYCLSKEGFVEFEGAPDFIHARIEYASLSGRKYATEMTPLGVKTFTRL